MNRTTTIMIENGMNDGLMMVIMLPILEQTMICLIQAFQW